MYVALFYFRHLMTRVFSRFLYVSENVLLQSRYHSGILTHATTIWFI